MSCTLDSLGGSDKGLVSFSGEGMSRVTLGKGFLRAWEGQLKQGETNKTGFAQAQGLVPASEEPRCWKLAYGGVIVKWKGNFSKRQESWLDLGFALTSYDSE